MWFNTMRWISLLSLLVFVSSPAVARSLPDFVKLVEDNSPAVVNISTTHKVNGHHPWGNLDIPEDSPFGEFFRRFLDEDQLPPPEDATSLGSGFIISDDGYVITNHHVIEEADEIIVRLSDKRELKAELVGSDEYTDIALLKIDAAKLPVVKIGQSDTIKVGAWVLAIGSPFGFDHSVTAGIVSAKGRSLPRANYVPFIQTDVAINPGNSGGPLFDLDGRVIGINSQIYSRTGGFMGLSFAIPIEVAMGVVEQIKKTGTVSRGWLGVYIQEVTQELAESFGLDKPYGALVSQVIKDSPAEKYGLKAGDVIVAFNDKPILDSANLPPLVGQVPVGSKAQLKILRNRQYKTVEVTIEVLPEDDTPVHAQKAPASSNAIGVEVSALTPAEQQQFGRGLRVSKVLAGSVAHKGGIKVGDIILELNRKDIKNVADFRKKVANLPTGSMIPVLVHRQGANKFLVLKIPEDD